MGDNLHIAAWPQPPRSTATWWLGRAAIYRSAPLLYSGALYPPHPTPAAAGSLPRPPEGEDIRRWLAEANRYRLDHALGNPDFRLEQHWRRSHLDGNDRKDTSVQWTRWYVETLNIMYYRII